MFRMSLSARRARRNGLASSLALALAIVGGSAVGVTAIAVPAHAEDKPKYTKAFVEAYKPLEDVLKKAKDASDAQAAKPLIQPMLDAIANDDDRSAAGSMLLQVGLKLSDKDLQQKGLMLQLDSGKVPQDKQAVFNYYVGGFAYDKQDYPTAAKYLTKAFDLGYRENDVESLIAESYFNQDQTAQGLAEIKRMEQVEEAAGSKVPEATLRRALKAVYDAGDGSQIAEWAAAVAKNYPSPDIWNMTLSVVRDSYDFKPDQILDLYRLMKLTNSLKSKQDYVYYVDAADARKLSNEVLPLLQEGISKGVLDAKDPYVSENLQVAQHNAPEDKSGADQMGQDARTAANGIAARAAADNFLALGEPAKAEEMYKLALQKGGVETDRVQMRIAVAQAEAGEYDAAKQSFQKVTGARAPVAKMWLAYIDTKQSPPPAAPASAPAAGDQSTAQ